MGVKMISDAVRRQLAKFSNISKPDLKSGQIILVPGTKKSKISELVIDNIFDHGNIAENKIIILCHLSDQPNPAEWILADCHNEYGSPVLKNTQILTCRQNISHFVKRRQEKNYETFKKQFLEDDKVR